MKINLAHTVAFQQMKCKCQSHRGDLSSDIVFSHDTCHAAEQDNSDSKVSFVRRPQQAKLGVFCPGPEGRNTAHLSALNGRCKERVISLVHVVASDRTRWKRQCEWWTLRSFPRSWLCRQYWESFLSTVDSFGGGLLWFFEIWKNRSAPSKHTGVFDVFPDFGIFEKSQMRGRIRKLMCWQILALSANNFLQSCL